MSGPAPPSCCPVPGGVTGGAGKNSRPPDFISGWAVREMRCQASPCIRHANARPSTQLTSSPSAAKGSNLVPASSGLAPLPLLLAARPLSPASLFIAATWKCETQGRDRAGGRMSALHVRGAWTGRVLTTGARKVASQHVNSQISSGTPQGWRAWQTSWRHSVRQWPPPAARAQKKGGSVRSCTNSLGGRSCWAQRHQE